MIAVAVETKKTEDDFQWASFDESQSAEAFNTDTFNAFNTDTVDPTSSPSSEVSQKAPESKAAAPTNTTEASEFQGATASQSATPAAAQDGFGEFSDFQESSNDQQWADFGEFEDSSNTTAAFDAPAATGTAFFIYISLHNLLQLKLQ
jgi:hypothetical protein